MTLSTLKINGTRVLLGKINSLLSKLLVLLKINIKYGSVKNIFWSPKNKNTKLWEYKFKNKKKHSNYVSLLNC